MIAIEIPKLEYQTISYTRLMSVDMPFSDHRRGTPYGEKNGPAIGIIGAIGSISSGFAAISAAGGLFTAAGLLGGLMVAGGIAGGLGALTGNKALSTFGAIAGLAGGVVGGFVNADTGAFFDPFSSAGPGFGGSVTGSAIKSVFTDIKSGLGITDGAMVTDIKANAGVVADGAGTLGSAGTEELKYINGESTSALGRAVDGVKDLGGGLLGGIGKMTNSLGSINALGGLADGYMKGQELEQLQPLTDAKVDQTIAATAAQQQQTDLIAQRQKNLQFQPNVAGVVNPNQEVYNRVPGEQNTGKYAVAVNGTIKYVTQAEYDAMRQAKGGTGMLSQGVA